MPQPGPRQVFAARATRASAAVAGVLTLAIAGASLAQDVRPSAEAGLRMLSWPGKPAARPSGEPASLHAAPQGPDAPPAEAPPAQVQVQPSVMPRYAAVDPGFPTALTPASAFGAPPMAMGGVQAYAAAPGGVPVDYAPVPSTPIPSTSIPSAPIPSASGQAREPADPNAPRADAPVRALAPATAPAPAAQASDEPRDGARYYSVHRQAGRQPDPAVIPEPFFLDSAPVDLAEPPAPPTIIRNQGGLAASVADSGL